MAVLRLVSLLALAAALAGCSSVQPAEQLRVSTPCAPSLVSVAVLF